MMPSPRIAASITLALKFAEKLCRLVILWSSSCQAESHLIALSNFWGLLPKSHRHQHKKVSTAIAPENETLRFLSGGHSHFLVMASADILEFKGSTLETVLRLICGWTTPSMQ